MKLARKECPVFLMELWLPQVWVWLKIEEPGLRRFQSSMYQGAILVSMFLSQKMPNCKGLGRNPT